MTARAAVAQLHARGWSTTQIARALGRNHGQISQIASGSKPGTALAPALSTLAARRHVPAAGEAVKPLTGRHAPPARRSPGVELPAGTQRERAGRGKTARAVYRLVPETGVVEDRDALRLLEGLRGQQAAVTVMTVWLIEDEETGEEEEVQVVLHLYPRGWDADQIAAEIRAAGGLAALLQMPTLRGRPSHIPAEAVLLRIEWIVVEQVLRGSRSLARAA